MKFSFFVSGFYRTDVGVYHARGTAWGKLMAGGDESMHKVVTEVSGASSCELLPTTYFDDDDIAKAEVKSGTLYITLANPAGRLPHIQTSLDLGASRLCDEGPNQANECMYDTAIDPAADNCLYCGQPFERK